MDCEEAREIRKNSDVRRVRIQRFAYDVFSYMLPLCGFPETTISNTNMEENDYRYKDFVKKSALSVLPLSMFVRDDWKKMFEFRHSITGFNSLEMIEDYIISNLTRNGDFMNADDATKVRVSLAFFSEMTLFFNYKSLETYVNKLPELWCDFYLEHITRNQDIEEFFASSFFMFPEATESSEWMIGFVKKFAVPYGSLNNVSRMFSVYSITSTDSKSSPLKKMSTNNKTNNSSDMPDAPADGVSDVIDKKPAPSLLEITNLSPTLSSKNGFSNSTESPANFKNVTALNAPEKQSTRVLKRNPNKHQKSPSELGINEALEKISLDSERVSQELALRETVHENASKKENK